MAAPVGRSDEDLFDIRLGCTSTSRIRERTSSDSTNQEVGIVYIVYIPVREVDDLLPLGDDLTARAHRVIAPGVAPHGVIAQAILGRGVGELERDALGLVQPDHQS